MTIDPQHPKTSRSEARVITNAGDTVHYFSDTRQAALFASGYADRFAMFVRTGDEPTADGRMMITFDCAF